MTKEIGTLLTEPTAESTSNSKPSTEAKKEGASLFDSLVQTASTEVNEESGSKQGSDQTLKQNKVEQATQNQATTSTQKKSASTQQTTEQSTQGSEAKAEIKNEQTSLLDRMIVEAKTALNTQTEEVQTPNKSEQPLTGSEENVDQANLKVGSEDAAEENSTSSKNGSTESEKQNKNIFENIHKISENSKNREQIIDRVTTHQNKLSTMNEEDSDQEVKTQTSTNPTATQNGNNEGLKTELSSVQQPAVLNENVVENSDEVVTKTVTPETKVQEQSTADSKLSSVSEEALVEVNEEKSAKTEKSILENNQKVSDNSKINDELTKRVITQDSQKLEPSSESETLEAKPLKESETNIKSTDVKSDHKSVEADSSKAQSKVATEAPKNEAAAKELSALNTQDEEQTVNISKESLKEDSKQVKKEQNDSMLDRIIKEAKKEVSISDQRSESTLTSQTKQSSETKGEVVSNIFLKNQQKVAQDLSMQQSSIAKTVVADGESLEDIKEGAKILELNMKDAKLDVEKQEVKDSMIKDNFKSTLLDRLAFNKNVAKFDLTQIASVMQTSTESINVIEEPMLLQVNNNLASSIQSRIIGARQQMGSMMSEVARQMVENYKPPVTAFRINLMPAHLGNIAIMMRSDRENNLSISLNLSNSNTLEAMQDSQNSLRSALIAGFGEEMNLSLDFSMNDESGSSFDEQTSNASNQTASTEQIVENLSTQNEEEESLSYM